MRFAYVLKAVVASILVILAIAFGVLLDLDKKHDVAAGLEWTIAFGYTVYLLTFWYDLRQSKGIGKGMLRPENLMANLDLDRFAYRYGYDRPKRPYSYTSSDKAEDYEY